MKIKSKIFLLLTAYFLFFKNAFAQGFQLPPPRAWTLRAVTNEILRPLADFLLVAGVLGGLIAIIISGIMYMKAGANETAIKKAMGWFRNGVWGMFIILAVYLIINTIALIVTGRFFR